jgi:hypothetical protein
MLILRIQDALRNNSVRPCAPAINAPPVAYTINVLFIPVAAQQRAVGDD